MKSSEAQHTASFNYVAANQQIVKSSLTMLSWRPAAVATWILFLAPGSILVHGSAKSGNRHTSQALSVDNLSFSYFYGRDQNLNLVKRSPVPVPGNACMKEPSTSSSEPVRDRRKGKEVAVDGEVGERRNNSEVQYSHIDQVFADSRKPHEHLTQIKDELKEMIDKRVFAHGNSWPNSETKARYDLLHQEKTYYRKIIIDIWKKYEMSQGIHRSAGYYEERV
ncbi:hypothetical protein CBS101457_003311 [Exobasidium rhododendri]|nr:hypothetical protein CBS101457_003311 [Exobasidium rhododendri]